MKNVILFLSICMVGFQTNAQQALPNLNKYPKSIIIKIYQVSQKVVLTSEKQEALAEIYLKSENELAEAIVGNSSRNDIEAIKAKYEREIRRGLTLEELKQLDKPDYVNDGSLHITTSKFYAAYDLAKDLRLTKQQIDSVLVNGIRFEQASRDFVAKAVGERFDAQTYENRVLSQILNEEQFSFLFEIKFRDIATDQAVVDWDEAKKRELTAGLDSATVVTEMIKYTMARRGIGARYKNDSAKRNELYAFLDESSPELLKKLKYARRYGKPLNDKGNVSKSSY